MSAERKQEVLRSVEESPFTVKESLERLDLPPSTYYRWKKSMETDGKEGLVDKSPYKGRVWNQLLDEEREMIISAGRKDTAFRHESWPANWRTSRA